MCFHSKQSKKAQALEKRFNASIEIIDSFKPSNHYNGFDFPKTPIITNENTAIIQSVQWGLVPHWADATWNKTFTLNARIETLNQKKSFKNILDNRCIIIVDGFFEWQHVGKQKIKHEIGFHNELFALAGLFDINNGIKTYTIVTTEAQGIMREIHNTKFRMPFALKTNKAIASWLHKETVQPNFDFSYKTADNQLSLF